MKKILASLVISTMLVLPTPVLAQPDNRVNVTTLSFDKIEQHINSYNYQIHANHKSLADIKVPSEADKTQLQGTITAIDNQINEYKNQILTAADEDVIDIYEQLITILISKASLQAQLEKFDENKNKASNGMTKAIWQTQAGNSQIVWGAEQLFITYNTLDHQIKQQTNQLNFLNKQLEAMKIRQKLGLVSMTTYKNLEKNYKELLSAVDAMNKQRNSIKEQLNLMFNQNHDLSLEIGSIPNLDQNLLSEMNLEDDYEIAEQQSFNVRAKSDSDTDEREAEERKFKLDFKKSYQNVLDKQESLVIKEFTLENQKELYDQAQVRYKVGIISKLAFEEQQITYENQLLTVRIAKDDLFKSYRQYEWLKKGLSL